MNELMFLIPQVDSVDPDIHQITKQSTFHHSIKLQT